MHSFVIHREIQCWPELPDGSVLTIRIPVSVLDNKDNWSDANTPKKCVICAVNWLGLCEGVVAKTEQITQKYRKQ